MARIITKILEDAIRTLSVAKRRSFLRDLDIFDRDLTDKSDFAEWILDFEEMCLFRGITSEQITANLRRMGWKTPEEKRDSKPTAQSSSKETCCEEVRSKLMQIDATLESIFQSQNRTKNETNILIANLKSELTSSIIQEMGRFLQHSYEKGSAETLSQRKAWETFYCHNSRDEEMVRRICDDLTHTHEIRGWRASEKLKGGVNLDQRINEALNNSATTVVFIGENGLGSYQEDELKFIKSKMEKGELRVIPCHLPGAPDDLSLDLVDRRKFGWLYKILHIDFTDLRNILLRESESAEGREEYERLLLTLASSIRAGNSVS